MENRTEPLLSPYAGDLSHLFAVPAGMGDVEADHLKPEFRSRLASVGGGYRFVAGLRGVLRENGFTVSQPRLHCGCPDCARRCATCAERLHAKG